MYLTLWIARNNTGELVLFQVNPHRYLGDWVAQGNSMILNTTSISCSFSSEAYKIYKDLKWEDDPIEIHLLTDLQIAAIQKDTYKDGYNSGYDSCLENEFD